MDEKKVKEKFIQIQKDFNDKLDKVEQTLIQRIEALNDQIAQNATEIKILREGGNI